MEKEDKVKVKKTVSALLAFAAMIAPLQARADAPTAWQGAVARLIASHQNYPRSAQIRGEEGTTRLRLMLAADGKINQVQLTQSSGSDILDREARSVVTGIGRLPAPPAGVTTLLVPIVWRLN
jgi:protein TonB